MPQLLLQGFPDGASPINATVRVLKKDKHLTYFVGEDNYCSHAEDDLAGFRWALATLMANGHVRPCEVEASSLKVPHRTLMRWGRQWSEQGPGSFYRPAARRGGVAMTPGNVVECGRLLSEGVGVSEVARRVGVGDSTLRKAIRSGRVTKSERTTGVPPSEGSTKSARGRQDAHAAEGMGTACTRANDRMAAALGLIHGASARFERCQDVLMGGLLVGLPVLCANGLLSGLKKHLSLPEGFYRAMHILMVLGFMALGRIRRPEQLRHQPPGEFGKVVGLDRVPEVRTLREKIAAMAEQGTPGEWMKELSRSWMEAEPEEAGYLYVDGHVRVYHGDCAVLPRRYVSRQRLCLRGTTDYWVNDALGRPFFVVSKAVTEGLAATLIEDLVPELLTSVPRQPSESSLAADPLLHRFVVIFDREGATYRLFADLWKERIAAITYRKAVADQWPESEFHEVEVPMPGGASTRMKLTSRLTTLSAGTESMPVLEVRRLTQTGHQTAIITSARQLSVLAVAGRMFSRWCQENYFGYMMQHYDIDGLVQYGVDELPGTTEVINPAWRALDKAVKESVKKLRRLQADVGARYLENDGADIHASAERRQDIQALETDTDVLRIQRKNTPRKVPLASLPDGQRPQQLTPMGKVLTDTVKMIAYRAETALVALLRPHLAKEDEARALIRELLVSSADLDPNEAEGTLTVRIHRMACPAHDTAVAALLDELTSAAFHHPETNARLIYQLA